MGGKIYTPNTNILHASFFFFEHWNFYDSWHLEVASRISASIYDPNEADSNLTRPPEEQMRLFGSVIRDKSFKSFSGSASLAKEISPKQSIVLELGHSNRAPSAEEMFSRGPHLPVKSFEIGNGDLKAEQGINLDIGYFFKGQSLDWATSVFANEYYNYIYFKKDWRTLAFKWIVYL